MSRQRTNATKCINQRVFWGKAECFSERLTESLRDTGHLSVVQQISQWTYSLSLDCRYLLPLLCPAQTQGRARKVSQGVVSQQCCIDTSEHHLLRKCFLLVRTISLRGGLCIESLLDQYIWYRAVNDLHCCKGASHSKVSVCVTSVQEILMDFMFICLRAFWGGHVRVEWPEFYCSEAD